MIIYLVSLFYSAAYGQTITVTNATYTISNLTSFQNASIQQTVNNGTYYLQFLQQYNTGYIHIQVYVPKQGQIQQVVLAYKQSAPAYKNVYNYLQADQVDYNGYYLIKQYLHIVIVANNPAGYLSILTLKPINYSLSITYSLTAPCAQNCSQNGICMGVSGCNCNNGWLDEDCSVPGVQLERNDKQSINFPNASTQYFYYLNPQNTTVKASFSTNSLLGIQLLVLYPNMTYLPTIQINNGAGLLNINSQLSQATLRAPKIIISVTPINVFESLSTNDELVIKISETDESSISGGASSTLIIIIVFTSVATCAVICSVICLVRRCRQQRHRQILEARRYMNHPVMVIQPQINHQVQHNIYAGLIPLEYEPSLTGENCSICLEEFQKGDDLRKTNCHHHFHNKCIKDWLLMHETCPMCRVDLKHQLPIQQDMVRLS